MKLRDYQNYAVDSIFNYFADGNTGNPIVAMPTGTGKSLVIGSFIQRALTQYPGTKIVKLTHVKELIEQNMDKLKTLWPLAPAGLYSAGLKRKEAFFPIVFGGVASVAKANMAHFGKVDLVLIDECHLLSPKEGSMYQKIIAEFKKTNPKLKVVGFTATDYRLGQGKLTGENSFFTDVCVDMTKRDSFNWFISQGYLVPLIPKKPTLEIDLSNVSVRGGEYKENELQEAFDKQEITLYAIKEMIQFSNGRKCWLIFASGIEHAVHVAEMLDYLGVPATVVHSKMPEKERDANIADFKAGKYMAMVNNGVLTTGFDHPAIDMIGMLRATLSTGLWVQMLGRGTRPLFEAGFDLQTLEGRQASIAASQKQNCLVMDFAGNTKRLGPINDPVLPKAKGKGSGVAPVKVCPACMLYNHASVRNCVYCQFEFPHYIKIGEHAGTDDLIATDNNQPITEIFEVDRVTYQRHEKEGKPDSLKVIYYCGLRSFKEYICFEHEGFASRKAKQWWRDATLENNTPETITDVLLNLNLLRQPQRIKVWLKQHPEIMNYEY